MQVNQIKKNNVFLTMLILGQTSLFTATPSMSRELEVTNSEQESLSKFKVTSSLVYQPIDHQNKYVYPYGTPIILESKSEFRSFRLEQYFSSSISAQQVNIYVHGNWALLSSALPRRSTQTNPYLKISETICDRINDKSRCFIDFEVKKNIPAGNIGLSLSYEVNHQEIFPIESMFTLIVPESENALPQNTFRNKGFAPPADTLQNNAQALEALDSVIHQSVVKVGLTGEFALGSGFIVDNPGRVIDFFDRSENSQFDRTLFIDGAFVLTAAHLFPNHYAPRNANKTLSWMQANSLEKEKYTISFADPYLDEMKADLVYVSLESDLALLYIDRKEIEKFETQTGGLALTGLPLATRHIDDQYYLTAGYPVYKNGALSLQSGIIRGKGWNTHQTANFGPLNKIQIDSLSEDPIAHPGMSGGPILNQFGEVIGLAIEKPNIGNSLVAIDLVSIDRVVDYMISKSCYVQFNPFERTLILNNQNSDCTQHSFGSEEVLPPLTGKWMIQEVMGVGDPMDVIPEIIKNIAGQSIIHGHIIIRESPLIDGVPIFSAEELNVYRETVSHINATKMLDGALLNPESFSNLTVSGVKVIQGNFIDTYLKDDIENSLIVGIKDSLDEEYYNGIHSVRDFTLWLKKNANNPDINDLICLSGEDCKLIFE